MLVSKPIRLGRLADRLTLNYRATSNGHIRVGLYEPSGKGISGYSLAECRALTGDELNQTVMWKSVLGNVVGKTNPNIGQLRRTHPVVRLKVEFKNADLFSLQFQPGAPSHSLCTKFLVLYAKFLQIQ